MIVGRGDGRGALDGLSQPVALTTLLEILPVITCHVSDDFAGLRTISLEQLSASILARNALKKKNDHGREACWPSMTMQPRTPPGPSVAGGVPLVVDLGK